MHHARERIEKAGAALAVVGSGEPRWIAGFREVTGFAGPVYSDPSLASYRAAGLKRGALRVLNPRSAAKYVGTLARGYRQGRTQGDPWQMSGLLLCAPPDRLLYRHASDYAGDYPPLEDMLRAIEGALAA